MLTEEQKNKVTNFQLFGLMLSAVCAAIKAIDSFVKNNQN